MTPRFLLTLPLLTIVAACPVEKLVAAERCVFPNDPSVLDVKRDFGAKGDGLADDTAALQAGIAASSNRGKDGWPLHPWQPLRRKHSAEQPVRLGGKLGRLHGRSCRPSPL